jgi:hypothetical protein
MVSLAKTLGALSFTPLTMLQACAQAIDFKVGHHFGEGQQPASLCITHREDSHFPSQGRVTKAATEFRILAVVPTYRRAEIAHQLAHLNAIP